MKKLILLLFPIITFSQVGVNTTSPSATLDVNGDLRVRQIPTVNATQYVLTVDDNGNVKKVAVSALNNSNGTCPNFLKNQSSGYYLLFSSPSSIQNPNNPLVISGLNFVSAGTWIQNNTYYYSYSNTTGTSLNTNNFTVQFGNLACNYNQ